MNLDKEFPMQVFINLGKAEDRRRDAMNMFLDTGLNRVERFPGILKSKVRHFRGHWNAGRYALSLTQKLVMRTAKQRRAPAVLIFEDDVVLHPQLKRKLGGLTLPDDWGIFYLGCQHLEAPEWAGPGVVRVRKALDLHAVAVRAEYYERVMSVLTVSSGVGGRTRTVEPSDREIAKLHAEIPTYAAYPNLAWQRQTESSLGIGLNNNYAEDGIQRKFLNITPVGPKPPRSKPLRPVMWLPQQPNVGLGDRLRGLAGMAAFAELGGRLLETLWVPTPACPGHFAEIASLPGVTVHSNREEFLVKCQGKPDYTFQSNITPDDLYRLLNDGDYLKNVGNDHFKQKWRQQLLNLSPSPETKGKVDAVVGKIAKEKPMLGVHIRRTDAVIVEHNRYRGLTEENLGRLDTNLLREFDLEWSGEKYSGVALACDDEQTARLWLEILRQRGLRVAFADKEWNPAALRQTSLEDAAVDLFLLARCPVILASVGGSFSWMASEIGSGEWRVVADKGEDAKSNTNADVMPENSESAGKPSEKQTDAADTPKKLAVVATSGGPREKFKLARKVSSDGNDENWTVPNHLTGSGDELTMLMRLHQWRKGLPDVSQANGTSARAEKRFLALCIPCGNRLSHLKQTLPSTLEILRTSEQAVAVVAEFACRERTADWVRQEFQEEIAQGSLVVVKVSGEERFRAARAKAVVHAVGCEYADFLLNLDADNFFSAKDLAMLTRTAMQHRMFIAQQQVRSWDMFGRLFLPADVYKKCGGYHASMSHYGFDDRGLIRNAVGLPGVAFLPIPMYSPQPIGHSHQSRTSGFAGHQEGLTHIDHIERARKEFEANPLSRLEEIEVELTDAAGTRKARIRWDGIVSDGEVEAQTPKPSAEAMMTFSPTSDALATLLGAAIYCINLGKRADRRKLAWEAFEKAGLRVERLAAVNKHRVASSRGLPNTGRYSCGLSKRLAIREAKRQAAPAVVIFEDDVVFHKDFRSLLGEISLPEDWEIFYLGCAHQISPEPISPGLVRAVKAYDNHAIMIRASSYNRVLRALRPGGKAVKPGQIAPSDLKIAELNLEIPCYAAYPNLAWQRAGQSDNQIGFVKQYHNDGRQVFEPPGKSPDLPGVPIDLDRP